MDEDTQAAEAPRERLIPETGYRVGGPFLAFYEHYGPQLCGPPLSDVVLEQGRPCQYFQCLALEEHQPGRVRLKPLGAAWLALAGPPEPELAVAAEVDLVTRLPRHPELHYPLRTLSDIRYLVLHHTGTTADVGPEAIAAEHVTANGWPGIGYHYVVGVDGTVFRTQDLTVASYHARQFNLAAVGIALAGDLSAGSPPAPQLVATASLAARLLVDLGLPPDALRGHREMVPTPCPGEAFLSGWKAQLDQAIATRLARRPAPAAPAAPAG